MPGITSYSSKSYAQLNDNDILLIPDSDGTFKRTTYLAVRQAALMNWNTVGTITAAPTSAPSPVKDVNIYNVDTSGGNINISAGIGTPAALGLSVGQFVVFRKSTIDTNKVTYAATLAGVATTLELTQHYAYDLSQIQLQAISTSAWSVHNH